MQGDYIKKKLNKKYLINIYSEGNDYQLEQ